MEKVEKIYKLLANKRRLKIIKYLHDKKEANVGDIADHIKISTKATSKNPPQELPLALGEGMN